MSPDGQSIAMLREEVANLMFGAVFMALGLAACLIAAIRKGSGVRLVTWLGLWGLVWGYWRLADAPAFTAVLPYSLQPGVTILKVIAAYLTIVIASYAFLELARGGYRVFLYVIILLGAAIAVAGIAIFAATGSEGRLMPYNNLLAACSLGVLLTVLLVPRLSGRFIVSANRGVLAVGTSLFAAQALLVNLLRPLGGRISIVWDSVAFAVLLASFGYVAVERIVESEHRLVAIENELQIARQLQFSILPETIPQFRNMRVAATYQPMTAVAGDFYEFLPVDENRAGFLIADVSGHGVPAALIASMIKVAAQSVSACAHDPASVLQQLGKILSAQLRGQFVSAAYLWLDTESGSARYSAAGHPPLLWWRGAEGRLDRVESNGLLFGVLPDQHYPVREITVGQGDRFLLYTDGIIEPENGAEESFGDHRLEQIVRDERLRPAGELSERLIQGLRAWQPASSPQQDDITLLVIDVV